MTRKQAIKRLQSLGFEISKDPYFTWGKMAPEPYDMKPHHFTPWFRDVSMGKAVGGYYITSSIKGTMRRYRCRKLHSAHVGNIFGKGTNLELAMADFEHNFNNKIYNVKKAA